MRLRLLLVAFGCLFPSISSAADSSPRELLTALNALAIDSQRVYTVSTKDRVELRKADTVLAFQDGKIAFFQSFEGRITGFVFSGVGHVVALPRDPVEKQQVARFLGAPVLDEQFLSAYVRFTDGTEADLLHELQRAGLTPAVDEQFAALWGTNLDRLNPSHSLRILVEKYSIPPAPFFHAGIDGVLTGPLDILIDNMQNENFSLGQPRTVGKASFYDVWSSYRIPDSTPFSMGMDAIRYTIETTIHPDNSMEASASIELEPFKGTALSISGIHLRGVHLGSFFNVNQPDPSGTVQVHDSSGSTSCKNVYFDFASPLNSPAPINPPPDCTPYPAQMVIPDVPHVNGVPGFRDPQYSVFFEAASKWDSVYDGLLVHVAKRLSHNFSYQLSYTYSHSIDDGPNPSFVLIPQDSANFRAERASSADDARHRFVGNAIFSSPAGWNVLLRDFSFSTIFTLQSPQYFSKYAGFDVNGDVFGNNDRVGSEPRNTFKGDSLQTVDIRLERTLPIGDKLRLQLVAEGFNLFNTVNVRYFNTSYGAADFCGVDAGAPGCAGAPQHFREGSPNPLYGTPSAVFNPRQIQLAVRLTW